MLTEQSAALGFEWVFVTSFASEEGRDQYLAHEEHTKFAEQMFEHIDNLVVADIRVESESEYKR